MIIGFFLMRIILISRAINGLENLPGLWSVEEDNRLVREAARLATELGLRGADSVYLALADQLDLPLETFDADQHQRTQKRITVQAIGQHRL